MGTRRMILLLVSLSLRRPWLQIMLHPHQKKMFKDSMKRKRRMGQYSKIVPQTFSSTRQQLMKSIRLTQQATTALSSLVRAPRSAPSQSMRTTRSWMMTSHSMKVSKSSPKSAKRRGTRRRKRMEGVLSQSQKLVSTTSLHLTTV